MMSEHDMTIINNRIAADRREKLERLRDEFAKAAPDAPSWFLPADLHEFTQSKNNKGLADRFFHWRYFYADQMLKAREQSK